MIEKHLNDEGHPIELVRQEELFAIRREWMFDPNEPDWSDELPSIYREVYNKDLNQPDKDGGSFTKEDAELLKTLSNQYKTPTELVMKLLELEIAMDGLGRRKGLFNKIESLLKNDWGALNEILAEKEKAKPTTSITDGTSYDDQLAQLTKELEALQ